LAVSNPEKLQIYNELTKTLQSVAGQFKPEAGANIWKATQEYTKEGFQEFIEKGGGFLEQALE